MRVFGQDPGTREKLMGVGWPKTEFGEHKESILVEVGLK